MSVDALQLAQEPEPVVLRLTLAESAALRLASIFGGASQMPDHLESARQKLRAAEYAARHPNGRS